MLRLLGKFAEPETIEAVAAVVGSGGVLDVANRFDTAAEFAERFPIAHRAAATALWGACDKVADERATAGARSRKLTTGAASALMQVTAKSVRPKITNGFLHRQVLSAPFRASSPPRKPFGEAVDKLWEKVCAYASASDEHKVLTHVSVVERQEYKNMWSVRYQDMPPSQIMARLRCFYAWESFADGKTDAGDPAPHIMAMFLHLRSQGGPTAAAGARAALGWTANRLGLNLKLDHDIVAPVGEVSRAHVPAQAEPHELKEVVHLEILVAEANAFVAHVATAALLLTEGTVRLRQYNRSRLLGLCEHVGVAACVANKHSKEGDKYRGYIWLFPRRGITDKDVGRAAFDNITSAVKAAGFEGPGCLLDIGPRGCSLGSAEHFLPQLMGQQKYRTWLADILMMPPLQMPRPQAELIVTYRHRRFMPSVGGTMDLNPYERCAIDNWEAKGDKPGSCFSLSNEMHVRYDDTKLQQAARAKVAIIAALRTTVQKKNSFDIHWDDLKALLPDTAWAREQAIDAGRGVSEFLLRRNPRVETSPFGVKPADLSPHPCSKDALGPVTIESASFSEDNSLACGEVSDCEQVALPQMGRFDDLWWALPCHKTALIHVVEDVRPEGVAVLCTSKLFRPATLTDFSLRRALMHPNRWCDDCVSKGPEGLKVATDAAT